MNELPWVLVHGALVWKLAAIVQVALGCLELRVSLHQRAHAMRRWAGAFFSRSGAADPHGNAVVEGVLERLDGDVAAFDDGAAAAVTAVRAERVPDSLVDAADRSACARAAKVGLRCDDGRLVELDGAILLLSAQTERWSHTRALKRDRAMMERVTAVDGAGAAMLEGERVVLASARWGERVQAYGRLESVQIMRETPRQVMSVPVSLEGGAPQPMPAIVMASVKPLTFVGPTRRAYARTALMALGFALAGQVVLGEFALLQVRGSSAGSGAVLDGATGYRVQLLSWATVAAVTPLRRTDALNFMVRTVRREPADRREVQMITALLSMTDDYCHSAVSMLARHGRAEEAIATGARCDTAASRWEAAEVAEYTGEFDRASALLDRTPEPPEAYRAQWIFATVTHLLAHRPERASFAARQAVAQLRRAERPQLAGEVECVAWALEARAGNGASERALAARADTMESSRCALLHADLLRGDARRRFMERMAAGSRRIPHGTPAWLLTLEADGSVETAVTSDREALPLSEHLAVGRWDYDPTLTPLAASVRDRLLATHRDDASQYVVANALLAERAMTGDRAGARAALRAFDEAFPHPHNGATDNEHDRALIEAAIDLRAGDVRDAATRLSVYPGDDVSRVRSIAEAVASENVVGLNDELSSDEARDTYARYFLGAQGDGLAAWLWSETRATMLEPLLAYGMFAVRGAAMTEWLRWGTRAVCWRCVSRDTIASHNNAWKMARTLGARDVEASERQSLARWGRALETRDLAVVLWVTESL